MKKEEISLDNKNMNKKIKQLRNKNLELRKVLYITRKEKDDYSQSINQSLKLLKMLKENGFDLSEIIENLSNSDNEDEEENMEEISLEDISQLNNIKYNDENSNKDKNESSLTNVSFGRLEYHEELSIKKIPKGIIPKLKLYNINKDSL